MVMSASLYQSVFHIQACWFKGPFIIYGECRGETTKMELVMIDDRNLPPPLHKVLHFTQIHK